jgi:hypothetical protein
MGGVSPWEDTTPDANLPKKTEFRVLFTVLNEAGHMCLRASHRGVVLMDVNMSDLHARMREDFSGNLWPLEWPKSDFSLLCSDV